MIFIFCIKDYKMICRILVEAGLTFLNTLFKSKLINDLYIFKSGSKIKMVETIVPQNFKVYFT